MTTPTRHPALHSWGDFDRDDPFPLFAQVRSAGPVHLVRLADGHAAWLIVGHEQARAALNDPRMSKDMHAALARSGEVVAEGLPGPALARHMLALDLPDHTRLRRLASRAFSRRRVDALRPRIESIVENLLDDLHARGGPDRPVDLVAGFAFPLPFTVICDPLGIPEPHRADLGRWFRTLLTPSSGPQPPDKAVEASRLIVDYLTALLDRKRTAPGEDMVTDLVVAADRDHALSVQEMLSTIFQLVVAGHDTTTSLIGNGTVALLRHPRQRDALAANPALVPDTIEECLRWDAPVPHSTFRYTTEEVRRCRRLLRQAAVPPPANRRYRRGDIGSRDSASRRCKRHRDRPDPSGFRLPSMDRRQRLVRHSRRLGRPLLHVRGVLIPAGTRLPLTRTPQSLRWVAHPTSEVGLAAPPTSKWIFQWT